jgi:hypothetical protein
MARDDRSLSGQGVYWWHMLAHAIGARIRRSQSLTASEVEEIDRCKAASLLDRS